MLHTGHHLNLNNTYFQTNVSCICPVNEHFTVKSSVFYDDKCSCEWSPVALARVM